MPGGRLLHIKLKDTIERLLAVRLRWLDSNQDWMEQNYDDIVSELCRIVAANAEEFTKRARQEQGKCIFKQIEESSLVSIAVSVESRESSGHNVLGMSNVSSETVLYTNVEYGLVVWIGPRQNSSKCHPAYNWPVDCIS